MYMMRIYCVSKENGMVSRRSFVLDLLALMRYVVGVGGRHGRTLWPCSFIPSHHGVESWVNTDSALFAVIPQQPYAPSALPSSSSVASQSPGPLAHPVPHHTMPPAPGMPSQASLPFYTRPPTHNYSPAFGMPYFRPPLMMGAGVARHPQPPSLPPVSASPHSLSRDSPQAPIGSSLTQGGWEKWV